MRNLLDELLHAAYMVQQCQHPNPSLDVGQTVGEMDWVEEIARLRQEIFCSPNSLFM